jgi:hypothetical protein
VPICVSTRRRGTGYLLNTDQVSVWWDSRIPLCTEATSWHDPAGDQPTRRSAVQRTSAAHDALNRVMAEARDRESRKADTLAMLGSQIDVWVATASAVGAPHLVPVSLGWVNERVVIAVEASSRTARNLTESGEARLAVGPTRDVVMIDAVLDRAVDVAADNALAEAYVAQADWDPRRSPGYVFLVLRPVRVQAWREANEIPGRTLMRHGSWLVEGGEEPRETR